MAPTSGSDSSGSEPVVTSIIITSLEEGTARDTTDTTSSGSGSTTTTTRKGRKALLLFLVSAVVGATVLWAHTSSSSSSSTNPHPSGAGDDRAALLQRVQQRVSPRALLEEDPSDGGSSSWAASWASSWSAAASWSSNPSLSSSYLAADALRAAQRLNISLPEATVADILRLIQSRTTSCSAVTEYYLNRIGALDTRGPQLHAFITVTADAARAAALKLDLAFLFGGGVLNGTLHCVPVVVKDNTDVAGAPTTCGVNALLRSVPRTSAWMVQGLLDQGAVVLGKTNMPAFANTGYNSYSEVGGLCRNPYNRSLTCFGSSGGTAAALAAGMAVLGIGTDTCGSITGPAGGNDLVGVRSTWGALSVDGVVPANPLFDVVGPLARTALDAAKALDAVTRTTNFAGAITQPLSGVRVALLASWLQPLSGWVVTSLGPIWLVANPANATVQAVVRAGAILGRPVASGGAGAVVTNLTTGLEASYLEVIFHNCASVCGYQQTDVYFRDPRRFPKWDPRVYHSLSEVIDANLLPAEYQLSFQQRRAADYPTACSECVDGFWPLKSVVQQSLDASLQDHDVLLYPEWLTPEFPLANATEAPFVPGQPTQLNACVLSAYSGFPSVTFPVGFTDQGVPIPATALARRGREDLLLRVAHSFASLTNNTYRRPPVF